MGQLLLTGCLATALTLTHKRQGVERFYTISGATPKRDTPHNLSPDFSVSDPIGPRQL